MTEIGEHDPKIDNDELYQKYNSSFSINKSKLTKSKLDRMLGT